VQHGDLGVGEACRVVTEQATRVLQVWPQYKMEEAGGHLVVLDVRIILVQRTGTGPQLLEVPLFVHGLLRGVAAALEGSHPLGAHDAHQSPHHGVGQQTAFFEGKDGVEKAFHEVIVSHRLSMPRPYQRWPVTPRASESVPAR